MGGGEAFADPPGILVTWLRQALKSLGCEKGVELVRLPRRRAIQALQGGQAELLAGVADVGPLAELVVIPPPPRRPENDLSLGVIDYSLYARRQAAPAWDGQQLPLSPGQRIGVAQATHAEELVLAHGWPSEPAPNHESALQKLAAGRSDLMLAHSVFVDERLRNDRHLAETVVKLEPPVERRRLFVGAEPGFEVRERAFVQRLWVALCRERQLAQHGNPAACMRP
jgi:ABC-type amino acid transport substrate-binding protein